MAILTNTVGKLKPRTGRLMEYPCTVGGWEGKGYELLVILDIGERDTVVDF